MTLSVYGADRIGAIAQQTRDLAASLAVRIDREPALERLVPIALNIVCFRYVATGGDRDRLNADIVADLQEAGIAAPSTTIVNGVLAIRAAIVNHRTTHADIAVLVDAVLEAGRVRAEKKVPPVIHRGQVYREASRLGDAGINDPLPATSAGTLTTRLVITAASAVSGSAIFIPQVRSAHPAKTRQRPCPVRMRGIDNPCRQSV
jgi:hypothetical protein